VTAYLGFDVSLTDSLEDSFPSHPTNIDIDQSNITSGSSHISRCLSSFCSIPKGEKRFQQVQNRTKDEKEKKTHLCPTTALIFFSPDSRSFFTDSSIVLKIKSADRTNRALVPSLRGGRGGPDAEAVLTIGG
jgi:hypothetical protein